MTVTAYGDGMVGRMQDIVGRSPDLILDAAPVSSVLPDPVQIAGGDPRRLLTITDFAVTAALGVWNSLGEDITLRFEMLTAFDRWAAEYRPTVPSARILVLNECSGTRYRPQPAGQGQACTTSRHLGNR